MVGGHASASNTGGAGKEAEELKVFDMKVYRAQMQMVKEMSARLKNLGIPFFGTRTDLVILDSQRKSQGEAWAATERAKGRVDEVELVELQRRVLTILEDLVQD
jgi:hypothetical protein